jgi:hypothetical protein
MNTSYDFSHAHKLKYKAQAKIFYFFIFFYFFSKTIKHYRLLIVMEALGYPQDAVF